MTLTANPPASPTNKPLWAAIAVLGIAVLAMGAALIRVQSQPVEPQMVVLPDPATLPTASASGVGTAVAAAVRPEAAASNKSATGTVPVNPAAKTLSQSKSAPVPQTNKTSNPANNPVSGANEPMAGPRVVLPQNPEPAVARAPAPARVACATCGKVESVTPVELEASGSGVGAVAGGVLGAVVGNQVGGGDGKTLATILGAVGGGMAGNAVEKKMNKVTHYDVTVRIDDGSSRTLRQSTPMSVGSAVVVNGDTLSPASR